MEADYSYQTTITTKLIKDLKKDQYSACLLAAYPGSGKTTISHMVLNEYLSENPNNRVLVLTHGQNLLKNQYINELKKPNVPINFEYGVLGENKQVTIAIPQSRKRIKGDIDFLVVDEAHHYYNAKMVQDIIKKHNIKKILLMTGTPSAFIEYNKWVEGTSAKQVKIHSISAEELIPNGIYSSVEVMAISTENPTKACSIHDCFKEAKKNNYNLDKIMVACKTIKEAEGVAEILTTQYGRKVSLTTSKNDPDNEYLDGFKEGRTDALVVVGRGLLGFNDVNLTCIFDLKDTYNVDNVNQLIARVLRKSPSNCAKFYMRTCGVGDEQYSYKLLKLIIRLINKEFFEIYDGDFSYLFNSK